MRKIFILFLFSILFIGCASTRITTIKNPNSDISLYKKILVFANTQNLEFAKNFENSMVKAFSDNNIEAVSSLEILPPLKQYNNNEIDKIFLKNNIDSILSVVVISADKTNDFVYVPQRTQTHYRSQYINGQFISIPYTTTTGGYSYTISALNVSFEIVFSDVKTNEIIFKSTAHSEGDDISAISDSLSENIIKEYLNVKDDMQ